MQWVFSNESHLDLAHALSEVPRRLPAHALPRLVDRWLHQAVNSDADVLLSAEAFARHVAPADKRNWLERRRAYLERVRELLRCFRVEPIIVLRRQDEFIDSSYREAVMRNMAKGVLFFGDYVQKRRDGLLRYWDNLLLFEEVFGKINVLSYDDLSRGGELTAAFFDSLGRDVRPLPDVGRVRTSLGAGQMLAKRYLNEFSRLRNRARLRIVRSAVISELLSKRLPPDLGFWSSADDRRNYLQRFEGDNRRIRERWFSDRDSVFAPVAQRDGTVVDDLPDSIKAELRRMARRWWRNW
ncbi:MAG: hypothetical protein LAT50_08330 [Ectothiorhodospiraceae bacterium]|nr:hypothetical protein [Ectothiorhodospiraceae bacterium]